MPAPPTLEGLTATGRHVRAPGVDVFEYVSDNGLKHVSLSVHETWRMSSALGADLQGRLAFMEAPEVSGLARLARFEPESVSFVYPTGTVWSVAEVVRSFADAGSSAGVKAGLELCYLVAESLVEAAQSGFSQGVFGHGNVNPWTLWLKADGQVVVLGYGVPQVELLTWRENQKVRLTEDSYRYAPPERVEGGSEDVSSDLLSLALVSLEVMTGRSVYDGVVADVRQQAARGEGVRRLYQWRDKLPQNVREVMSRALKADPDTRFPTGMDFVHAVHDLLGSIEVEGPSLVEVMARVRATERRGRAAGKTGALSAAEMAELAADLEEFEDRKLPPPKQSKDAPAEEASPAEKPRWGKVLRSTGTVAATPEPADRPRRRLRADGPPTSTVTSPLSANKSTGVSTTSGDEDARERLRRRLRDSAPQVTTDPRTSPAAALPPRSMVATSPGPESGELDLSTPDDVQLEPITGRPPLYDGESMALEVVPPRTDTGRVLENARAARTPAPVEPRRTEEQRPPSKPPPSTPPPPDPGPATTPPAPVATEAEAAPVSSAAALLERLRTSGGRRRRGEVSVPIPGPAPARAPEPVPSPPVVPAGLAASGAVVPKAERGGAAPTTPPSIAPASEPRVAPGPRAGVAPMLEPRAASRAPESAGGVVEVSVGDECVRVPPGSAREVAARVVTELALPLFDLTGRFGGSWRLYRGEAALPPDQGVGNGSGLHLRRVRTGPRPIRFELDGGRPLELPVETGLTARWLLVGLAEWGLRADPTGAVWFEGRALHPQETLAEALEAANLDPESIPLVSVRPLGVSS